MRTVVRQCLTCGEEFTTNVHRVGKFCSRSCTARSRTGARNSYYKGGVFQRKNGRWGIVARDGRTVSYYRAVMEAELGRELRADELVHHINGDPSDDRIENLMVVSSAEHAALHAQEHTHCARGHEWTKENTYVRVGTRRRVCITCRRMKDAERRAKKRAERPPKPPRTRCFRGHEWVEENLYVRPDGYVVCHLCVTENRRKYEASKRQVAA